MENNLIKITELGAQLGLSSRSLRYYEQVGLIESVRPAFEKYRFYDTENIERLKQIIVLRKMQIPVKDILRIYESASMETYGFHWMDFIAAIPSPLFVVTSYKSNGRANACLQSWATFCGGEKGGKSDEVDLYGQKGRYIATAQKRHIGKACPVCGNTLGKASVGGVTAFCPHCQAK